MFNKNDNQNIWIFSGLTVKSVKYSISYLIHPRCFHQLRQCLVIRLNSLKLFDL